MVKDDVCPTGLSAVGEGSGCDDGMEGGRGGSSSASSSEDDDQGDLSLVFVLVK